jgi:hypothetical protein
VPGPVTVRARAATTASNPVPTNRDEIAASARPADETEVAGRRRPPIREALDGAGGMTRHPERAGPHRGRGR